MRPEPPDSRFYAEITDLNLEFLRLVADSRRHRAEAVFGLEPTIADLIARLTSAQLLAIAETRCLLAGLRQPLRLFAATGVAEARGELSDRRWLEAAQVFAAGLITYAWQVARRDPLRATLCLGALAPEFRELGFRDAQRYSAAAPGHLEARFHAHSRLWTDLVTAAYRGGEDRLRLARLGVVQVALSDAARRALPAAALAAYVREDSCAAQ
jgi:hypothetical protein